MMALATGEALRLAKLPRHHRKALLLDECWAFVESGAGGDFIENALRVYRAFNCAVFLSSQTITDFLGSRLTPVIMTNCPNFFLLRTVNTDEITIMQNQLNLTHKLTARFASMPDPSDTDYSHFIYVYRGGKRQIAGEGINRIGKTEGLLYSTSPRKSQLRDLRLKNATDPWEQVLRLANLSDQEFDQERQKLFETPPNPT